MINGKDNAFDLIVSAFKIFGKHPVLVIPLFIVWIIYASLTIYMKWEFPWENYNLTGQLVFLFLFIYILALCLTLSCSILLELLQHNETGRTFSFRKSIKDSFTKNLPQVVVLSIIWSVLWFLLVLLQILLSKDKNGKLQEKTSENIARTLVGSGNNSAWSGSIDLLKKGIRMIVFLIMPAAAWENLGVRASYARGIEILKQRKTQFAAGLGLTLIVELLLFFYPGIMFFLSSKGVEFSEISWYICILYIGISWSLLIYIEQLFAAELFLWHKEYEKQVNKARVLGEKIPEFKDVKRPLLLDDQLDLLEGGIFQ